jgi:hypothetical protein
MRFNYRIEVDKKNRLIGGQLNSERLIHIFNNNLEDLICSIDQFRESTSEKNFKCEMLICFWFSIHLGLIAHAHHIYQQDPII